MLKDVIRCAMQQQEVRPWLASDSDGPLVTGELLDLVRGPLER